MIKRQCFPMWSLLFYCLASVLLLLMILVIWALALPVWVQLIATGLAIAAYVAMTRRQMRKARSGVRRP